MGKLTWWQWLVVLLLVVFMLKDPARAGHDAHQVAMGLAAASGSIGTFIGSLGS